MSQARFIGIDQGSSATKAVVLSAAGQLLFNTRTGGFLMLNTGRTLVPAPGLMASAYYSNDRERQYLLEGSVNTVGEALEWVRAVSICSWNTVR